MKKLKSPRAIALLAQKKFKLTKGQTRVFEHAWQGHTAKQTAQILGISYWSVRQYENYLRKHIGKKSEYVMLLKDLDLWESEK